MRFAERTIAALVVSASLALTAGCDTTAGGAAAGGIFGGVLGTAIGAATGHPELGAAIGVASGITAGAIIGSINEQQRSRLAAEYPQTLQTVQHNDAVYQQQQQQPQPAQQQPAQQQPAPQQPATAPTPAPAAASASYTPITVDDIKALDSTGVKKDVIIAEIERSHSVYSAQDIATLQQADPNIDPAVIDCMKQHPS